MKNKKSIIIGVIIAVILAIVLALTMLPKDNDKNKSNNSSNSSSTSSDVTVEIEDVEENSSIVEPAEEDFLEPDESEADKILEQNKPKTESTNKKTETKPTASKESATETFEEGEKKLEDEAEAYLKKHNIDPKTAGETGEVCTHCGKKIWNPDKYGFFIPGMPDDYENSGYCLGTCGITFG